MLPEALPYHLRVRDHFRQQTSVWEFFSAAAPREEQLSADERHARMQLSTLANGELEIAGRIVSAIVGRENSEPGYLETARLFNLYTRIHGDRCAGEVTADPAHPEYLLRIRALQLWQEQAAAADIAISRIVEGPRELGRLDIFSQAMFRELTRELIFEFLRPGWIRTPSMIAIAYAYFADHGWDQAGTSDAADEREKAAASPGVDAAGNPAADPAGEQADCVKRDDLPGDPDDRHFSAGAHARLTAGLTDVHGSVRDYFAFVLLDFVKADPSLEQRSAARASALAADLSLSESFGHLYNRKSS